MDVLEVKGLTKKFGDFVAVDNLSLNVEEGEILGLLGPNGAGKTTTMQMLLGIMTPTDGEISYFGKSLKHNRAEILEKVSFSSTYINLMWNLTVRENLAWVAHMYKIADKKKRVDHVIETFRLGKIAQQTMNELSAGQLTRVNMAKAFVNLPRVYLLDEPTASLDVEIAKYIREFILEQRKTYQVSVVITSHNMVEVEELCDRIIVINHGKIIANDTPRKLVSSIKRAHMELAIEKNMEEAIEYCEKEKLSYHREDDNLFIDVESKKIPDFLSHLVNKGILYSEISIERPSLEDYFLQVIGEEKYENL